MDDDADLAPPPGQACRCCRKQGRVSEADLRRITHMICDPCLDAILFGDQPHPHPLRPRRWRLLKGARA